MLIVREIWRYPVKSMGGESLEQVAVGETGVLGDRTWAVRDEVTGKPFASLVTRLRGLAFKERVRAMIGLAAPQHREALEREARELYRF